MKRLFFLSLLFASVIYCTGPKTITTTPSNHTNTSGTLGSGNMTRSLPPGMADTSAAIKRDTLPAPR